MNTKKQLLSQDDILLESLVAEIREFKPLLAKVKSTYEGLQIGDFNGGIFDLIRAGGAKQILDQYFKILNDNVERMQISHPTMRQVALAGTQGPAIAFNEACNALLNFTPGFYSSRVEHIDCSDISFVDGQFMIDEQAKENIAERFCRIYLESGTMSDLYQLAQKAQDVQREFAQMVKGIDLGFGIRSSFRVLDSLFKFDPERNTCEINPARVKSFANGISREKHLKQAKL